MTAKANLLLLTAGLALAYQGLAAEIIDPEDNPPRRMLKVKPRPIAADKSVKYDYDIVYVRAPRTIKDMDGKERSAPVWPEISHPYNLQASTDLMLLHPNGSEELLVPGGEGAIADPYVSFDAEWVYYTHYHALHRGGYNYRVNPKGADVYKVHVRSRRIVRLTEQRWTPNTGVADWSEDFRTPQKGKTTLDMAVANIHPCPLPGGRVALVSNRDAFKTPRGSLPQALQLFVMDEDGKNVEKIGHLNVAGALHPVILKDGRIIFSSLESQGLHNGIMWGIWSIHPDGTNWGPVVSALFQGAAADAFHFQSQLSDGRIVVERYYNGNTQGFGTYYTLPPAPPEGVPGFGPGKASLDPKLRVLGTEGGAYVEWMRFQPYGMKALTRFTHGHDNAAPPSDRKDPKSPRLGKVQHPCGAPDNHLLTIWTPGAAPNGGNQVHEPAHAGIYLIKSGKPIWEPGEMLLIKHDPNFNAQWPRPLVPYKRIYGVDEPALLPTLRNDGKSGYACLPRGTPFGLVGASSLYKRESFPDGVVPPGKVTSTGDPLRAYVSGNINWDGQGSDAGLYSNNDIHAIRILAMEPASFPVTGKFFNHAHERLRIFGEFPVRKFTRDGKAWAQPTDPDGNPDTSWLARIPADMAFTFQMVDKDGMNLTMAQTWHQVRPGEVRNNCGGCHSHSQPATPFEKTAAARSDYPVWNLAEKTPLLAEKKRDESGKQWDVKNEIGVRFVSGVKNVEYWRDVRPILDRSCVACHTQKAKKPAGDLVLDADDQAVDGNFLGWSNVVSPANPAHRKPPGTYFRLAMDNGARGGNHLAPLFGKKPASRILSWFFPLASRYVTMFQSRRSLLIWKVYGRRTDGLPASWITDKAMAEKLPKELLIDYNPAVMPPPEAVAGTYVAPDGRKIKVAPLSDEDRRTLVRWIDLGCPIDLDYDPAHPEKAGRGWGLDDQRPTLTLTSPLPGANKTLTSLLVGMHDYGTGLNLDSFEVKAEFPLDGAAAGENLAKRFKALPDHRWELQLARPITELPRGKLTVSVKDKQGNTSRIERTFSVGTTKP